MIRWVGAFFLGAGVGFGPFASGAGVLPAAGSGAVARLPSQPQGQIKKEKKPCSGKTFPGASHTIWIEKDGCQLPDLAALNKPQAAQAPAQPPPGGGSGGGTDQGNGGGKGPPPAEKQADAPACDAHASGAETGYSDLKDFAADFNERLRPVGRTYQAPEIVSECSPSLREAGICCSAKIDGAKQNIAIPSSHQTSAGKEATRLAGVR